MATNPSPSLLDAGQIIKRAFDGTNDCVRVNIGDASGLSVSLSAAFGDTIGVQGVSSSTKASLTSASTGVVVAAFSIVGMKSFNLYTNTTATITGAQVLTLQISPSDTDNVWIDTSLTITPSTTNAVVVMGTPVTNIIARRARVSIASAISSGTFDVYVVNQGI